MFNQLRSNNTTYTNNYNQLKIFCNINKSIVLVNNNCSKLNNNTYTIHKQFNAFTTITNTRLYNNKNKLQNSITTINNHMFSIKNLFQLSHYKSSIYCLLSCSLISMTWACSGRSNNELIDNLYNNNILKTQAIFDAMKLVDRKYYVPYGTQNESYNDNPLPIGVHNVVFSNA